MLGIAQWVDEILPPINVQTIVTSLDCIMIEGVPRLEVGCCISVNILCQQYMYIFINYYPLAQLVTRGI